METRAKFFKLYEHVKEEGILDQAVISFRKWPWVQERCEHKSGANHVVIIEYKKRLHVNFWFVLLRFEWNKKHPNTCKYKYKKKGY